MSWNSATVPVPKRTLVAFDRISLKSGQSGSFQSTLRGEQMAVWHDDKGFVVEPGEKTFPL